MPLRDALARTRRSDRQTRREDPAGTRGARRLNAAALLAELAAARGRYGTGAADVKLALLAALDRQPLRSAAQFERAHDHLLYLAAFPDDARVLRAARRRLATTARRLARLPRAARQRLEDSGIAGSRSRHTYDAAIAQWLCGRFPEQAEIDWSALRDPARLEALLRLVLLRAEEDGFDAADVTVPGWLRRARNPAHSALAWLVTALSRAPGLAHLWQLLYTDAELPLVWSLGPGRGSVSGARLPGVRIVYRAHMRAAPRDPLAHVTRPLRGVRLLDRRRARAVIDLARVALTARCREAYVINHANPGEVYLADLGAGVALAVIGAQVDYRPALEANFGFLLLANGVPIGYGGVSPLHRQANTGINIFPAFRGSEAAFVWAQALRAFHTLFGVQRFIINPYQFGAGNAEAIESGAFWFYYRLGFLPVSAPARALAAREARRLAANPRHRSDRKALRRLAADDLELLVPGGRKAPRFDERWLPRVGLAASAKLAELERTRPALRAFVAAVAGSVGLDRRRRRVAGARAGFEALAPVVALLDAASWPRADRRAVAELLRKKGAPAEAGFARAAAGADRFFAALARLSRG